FSSMAGVFTHPWVRALRHGAGNITTINYGKTHAVCRSRPRTSPRHIHRVDLVLQERAATLRFGTSSPERRGTVDRQSERGPDPLPRWTRWSVSCWTEVSTIASVGALCAAQLRRTAGHHPHCRGGGPRRPQREALHRIL